jgi:4'-phosphopantetheinyl transferase EntD
MVTASAHLVLKGAQLSKQPNRALSLKIHIRLRNNICSCVSGENVIRQILPSTIVSVERSDTSTGVLLPEEEVLVEGAVPNRIAEFATGRTCAREAFTLLGMPVRPVLRGPAREPLWPKGIVGSITHCDGYYAAALAFRKDIVSVGIDAERNEPIPSDVLAMIAQDQEVQYLNRWKHLNDICWDRLLFSAKESLYKAWYPLTKSWLGFKDAMIYPNVSTGSFSIDITHPSVKIANAKGRCSLNGRFICNHTFVFTSVVVSSYAAVRIPLHSPQ